MTDLELAILDALKDKLTIETNFTGWDYNDVANELEIVIKFGDTVIDRTTCRIQPVERGDDW